MGMQNTKLSKLTSKFKKKSTSSSNTSNSSNSTAMSSLSSNHTFMTLMNSTSNHSSVNVFKFEDGRRYINDDSIRYPLPNDEQEIDRLQMQHYLLRYIWQSNFSAPVKEILNCGAHALDVGCGPGSWVLEMASDFPQSSFVGIDIAPIFPAEIKPVNAQFQIQNVTHRLPFEDDSFDYVHMRLMLAVLHENEWKNIVLPELFRVLKPGGYIESHEFDFNIVNQGPCMKRLVDAFIQYFKEKNMNPIVCPHVSGYLRENNFTEINVIRNKGHYGSNNNDRFGQLALEDFIMLFKALKSPISSILEMNEDKYLNLLGKLEQEVDENQTFYHVYRFIGKKTWSVKKKKKNILFIKKKKKKNFFFFKVDL